jgi:thiol:disulfide interchange protein
MSDSQANAGTGPSCSKTSGCPACGGSKFVLLAFLVLGAAWFFLADRRSQAPAGPSAVSWMEDYDAAMITAARKNQPVLLAFKATWCGPCKQMDREVFAQPAAAKALTDWVPVHIDLDANKDLARKYQVEAVPTLIVLSPAGKEVARTEGAMALEEFGAFLASAQSKLPAQASLH